MTGDPRWHIDINVYGDDDVTFARATLTAHHRVTTGHGAARTNKAAPEHSSSGDAAAVGAALQDLGRRLAKTA
jgi:hypothetical protein